MHATGFEHAAALGGTLQSIAAAKAGILKAGRPVVISQQQHPEALQVRPQPQRMPLDTGSACMHVRRRVTAFR